MTMNPSTIDPSALAQYRGRLVVEGEQIHSASKQIRHANEGNNVADSERYASLASGAIVALLGLARRDVTGVALAAIGGGLIYRGATGRCPMYQALNIDTARDQQQFGAGGKQARRISRGIRVTQAFTIDRPARELYDFWRRFESLPRIMTHLESVTVTDDRRSHWVAKAPAIAGGKVEWDAELVDDVPGERISWRSLPGADVDNAGSVRFEAGPRGTVVRVEMSYVTPAGKLGSWIATLFGTSPERQIREDLRNFKRAIEIGEVLTILDQPRGTCTGQGTRYAEKNDYLMPPTV